MKNQVNKAGSAENTESKKKPGKTLLVASVIFIIAAFIWLFQAINYFNIMYVLIAVIFALIAGAIILTYFKQNK